MAGDSGDELMRLRRHVVNLREGRLSSGGDYRTTQAEVDAIFDHHLPAAAARSDGRPLPVVLYAHGGLVNEASGLRIAQRQVSWWLRNGAYPLHFVWESGLGDALGQLMFGALGTMQPGLRHIDLDPVVEAAVRPVGRRVWQAMKQSAAAAAQPAGGARYVAARLARYCHEHPDQLTVHAVGHSAGAVFHGHLVPALLEQGVPEIASVQLLAPAIRVDDFSARLGPLVGNKIGQLVMYTMRRELELADNCINVYGKSLLYLIRHALEREREAAILGLEDCVRADAQLAQWFDLSGGDKGPATVVWSTSPDGAPPHLRSTSTTHGGFDDDAATMQSVARCVLGRAEVEPFPNSRGSVAQRALVVPADNLPAQHVGAGAVQWQPHLQQPAWSASGQRGRLGPVGQDGAFAAHSAAADQELSVEALDDRTVARVLRSAAQRLEQRAVDPTTR